MRRVLRTIQNKFNQLSTRAVSIAGHYHTNWMSHLWSTFGTSSKAGAEVTAVTAMQHTAVMSCWKVLSEGVAQLPLHLMQRKIKDGTVYKNRAYDHKLYNILNLQPNSETTSYNWIEATMMNLVSRGTSYSQIVYSKRGEIIGFVPLLTDSMLLQRRESGEIVYIYTHEKHGQILLEKEEVLHVVGLSFDGINGLSPIAYSKNSIGLSLALEEHGSNLFANGANPGAIFEKDSILSEEAYQRLKVSIAEKYTGLKNSNKPILLEEGMKFKQVGLNNNDAQFLESRKYQKAEIASIFRVPLHFINDLEHATFSNIEQQSLEFATFTLTPWIRRIEQSINIALQRVDPSLYVHFNMDSMVRGDIESRYNANGTAIRDGWKTRNEVRVQEGLNPIDGLDDPILPLNMGKGESIDEEK